MTDETPRYATLSDYLRVLRRQRLLIAVITLVCTGLALAHALTKDSVYVASTQIQFRDPLADLNIVGITGDNIPELAPNQRSALNAQLLTRSEVTRRVAKDLKARVSPAGLRAAISANVDPQTNLVNLQASWGNAKFAAALANAYANAVRDVEVHDFRQRLRRAENALEQQLRIARQDLAGGTSAGAAAAGASFRVAALEQNLTQVRALESVADPVQIAGRAQVPGAPTSPRPVRDGILGFVLGLVLGLLVAFIRDALDRRLRTSQEVHDELDMPVLGRTGQAALKHNGLIANGRPPLVESEFEAFRVLRTNLGVLADGKPPKVVLVTSPAPEEGKSTVSLSLACAAGLAGQRVLLLEADLRRPSLAPRVGAKPEPGLSDYLTGTADLERVTQKARLAQPRPDASSENGSRSWSKQKAKTIDCIMAGKRVSTAPELLESSRMQELLSSLRDTYDLVVIDARPMLAVADSLGIAPFADALLICVRAQRTTREQARAVRSALSHIEEKPAGAVLTGLQRGDETYGYYYGY
jgi:Mrp family chromosome partitioning ATPase